MHTTQLYQHKVIYWPTVSVFIMLIYIVLTLENLKENEIYRPRFLPQVELMTVETYLRMVQESLFVPVAPGIQKYGSVMPVAGTRIR